jgi:hypothetical protein
LRFGTRFRRYRRRRVPFSCFACPDSFSAVPRASGPVFMFCVPGHVFGGAEGVGSCFHVLCSRTSFRRYRGRRLLFLCFARPNTFSTVPTASGPVFMFCAPGHVYGGTEGFESRFHVMRSRTHFLRYRGCRVPFSCFARPDSFSVVLRRWLSFSCFTRPNSFSAVLTASGPVFIFCAPEHVFGGVEGVGSHFHILCSRTRFRRSRVRQVVFSCFARQDSFSAVPRASGPVFMFCAPEHVLAVRTA